MNDMEARLAKDIIAVHATRLRGWAERAKSAQVALDLSKDPEVVAIRAGQLQDLAEDILRVVEGAYREWVFYVSVARRDGAPLALEEARARLERQLGTFDHPDFDIAIVSREVLIR
jgi:hypothetical protein